MIAAFVRTLRRLTAVPVDNPELLKAQYAALSRQMPLFFIVLTVSAWALAATHFSSAPRGLTLGFSSVLTAVCLARAIIWWRSQLQIPETAQIIRRLTVAYRMSALMSSSCAVWAFALYPYGNSYAQAHVTFFMVIMVMVVMFCTMHLRPAALVCTAFLNTAFVVFFVATGNSTFIAFAINYVLVSAVMLMVMQNHYRDFTSLADMHTQTARLSEENRRLANQDSLTGLPNRRQFFLSLDAALQAAQREGKRVAVGILDLDGFKPVNDVYGHGTGDRLLVQVGQRLVKQAGRQTQVARLGGDEFALIITADPDDTTLEGLGRVFCTELRAPYLLGDVVIQISASLGIATYPDIAGSADEIYQFADYALYQSKRRNTGAACLFSPQLHGQLHRDAMTEQALRRADLNAQLHLLFQPMLDCTTGHTLAFEALARWASPELGAVMPGHFIPVAERTGLIKELTIPLLRKALQAALTWPVPVRLAFNLTRHDCASRLSVQAIVDVITASGLDPARLELEITETAFMQDAKQVQRAVYAFRQIGCGVTLDNFGTGYSKLSQLDEIAITQLKIDRSFVNQLHLKPASYKVVKALIGLSEDMALACVVAGVESAAEMSVLQGLGVTRVQGFLFCAPMPVEQTLGWLGRPPEASAQLAMP